MSLFEELFLRRRAESRSSGERLVRAGLLQFLIFLVGTVGYYFLPEDEVSLLDAAYMTVITITTVGYDESIPVDHDPTLMIFTIFLVIIGMGAVLYFVSVLAAFMIEGELRDLFRRGRMEKAIGKMEGHFVVAGLGRTGRNLAQNVIAQTRHCVLIEEDLDRIEEFLEGIKRDVPYVVGDATDDEILKKAGVERARGIGICLGDDKENLFATISAHRLNETARIITKGDDPRSEEKFLMAGASQVVFINGLGGRHMAAQLVQPRITDFMGLLFSHPERDHDIDRIKVGEESPLRGKSLGEIDLRRFTDALVIAIITPEGESRFSPGPGDRLEANAEMVVLARNEEFAKLERFVATGEWPE